MRPRRVVLVGTSGSIRTIPEITIMHGGYIGKPPLMNNVEPLLPGDIKKEKQPGNSTKQETYFEDDNGIPILPYHPGICMDCD